ncbi:MAG TPA: MEDS domain-containing protein [Candidatus Dormibacteraeota bacterium]|nr:MEDS domain-containing protein [Candidatus Dormibacteraeota bacterium]
MNEVSVGTPFTTKSLHTTRPEAHVVQFYAEDAFLVDSLTKFVSSGLGAGKVVIVIGTKKHREGLRRSLQARGIDVTGAVKRSRYIVLDAAETMAKFMDGDLPNERKFQSLIGSLIRKVETTIPGQRVAVFGEMVALLWEKKNFEAALRLEQLWNELARTHFFYLRCAYPTSGFQGKHKGRSYSAICAEHSGVIPAEA